MTRAPMTRVNFLRTLSDARLLLLANVAETAVDRIQRRAFVSRTWIQDRAALSEAAQLVLRARFGRLPE